MGDKCALKSIVYLGKKNPTYLGTKWGPKVSSIRIKKGQINQNIHKPTYTQYSSLVSKTGGLNKGMVIICKFQNQPEGLKILPM